MRIAVVTLAIGEEYTKSIELGLKSKEMYCEAHCYENIVGGMSTGRPASWEKIPLVLAILHKFDWVFFTDGDTMIMNQSVKLEDLIAKYGKHDIIFTRGIQPNLCNAGVFLVKNCSWSKNFLEAAYDTPNGCNEIITFGLWEQGMIAAMLIHNSFDCWQHVTVEQNRRAFNSVMDIFEDGDFLIHFIMENKSYPEVQAKMEKYFPRILPYSMTSNPS